MAPHYDSTDSPEFRPPIDGGTLLAARRFLAAIGTRYAIRDAYSFGSRARGTHQPDSDADVAVILRGKTGDRGAAIIDMADVAFDILIEATSLWEGQFGDFATR